MNVKKLQLLALHWRHTTRVIDPALEPVGHLALNCELKAGRKLSEFGDDFLFTVEAASKLLESDYERDEETLIVGASARILALMSVRFSPIDHAFRITSDGRTLLGSLLYRQVFFDKRNAMLQLAVLTNTASKRAVLISIDNFPL